MPNVSKLSTPLQALPKFLIFLILSASFSLSVTINPPWPVLINFGVLSEKQPIFPNVPRDLSFNLHPIDWAASSNNSMLLELQKFTNLFKFLERLFNETWIIHFVLLVIFSLILSILRVKVSSSTSTITGFSF